MAAFTLGLASGCGGKYAVGSGEPDGGAGEGGAGDMGSGGSGTAQGGSAQGGMTATGGTGEGASPGTGGMGAGDTGGTGMGAAGGSGGNGPIDICASDPGMLPYGAVASPDVVWDRINLFLHGDTRAPFEPLPGTTTLDWVRERVAAALDEPVMGDGSAPAELAGFLREWAFEGESENAEFWASSFARPDGNFTELFDSGDEPASFLIDRDFLVAHPNSTRRGIWMASRLFCRDLGPPPPDVGIEPVVAAPMKTRRQTIEEMVAPPTCAGCHQVFDPLGFSLEHYDENGEYRTTENGIPIDASGAYDGMAFGDIDGLARQLPEQCDVQRCFARTLLDEALARAHDGATPMYDLAELEYVVSRFREGRLALRPLLQAIATTPAFLRE